jgi:hypothetical protein
VIWKTLEVRNIHMKACRLYLFNIIWKRHMIYTYDMYNNFFWLGTKFGRPYPFNIIFVLTPNFILLMVRKNTYIYFYIFILKKSIFNVMCIYIGQRFTHHINFQLNKIYGKWIFSKLFIMSMIFKFIMTKFVVNKYFSNYLLSL